MNYILVVSCIVGALFLIQVVHGEDGDDGFFDSEEKDASVVAPGPLPVGDVRGSQIAIPAASGDGTSGSSHGSNYAGFNQKCSMDGERGVGCNTNLGLTCDMRVCKCKNSTLESDLYFVYSPLVGKCFPVARASEGWSCEVDPQCQFSKQGNFSRCNFITHRCECQDTSSPPREVVLVGDICYVKKEIQSKCTSDIECQATIKGRVVCLGLKQVTNVGVCECAGGYSYDPLLKECLEIGINEESGCKSDRQCNDKSALGLLSRCNPNTGKCQCWDTENHGNKPVGFYRFTQKCYFKKSENETCELREECFLGFHRKSDCLVHPAYNDEKVCQCPSTETCSGNGNFPLSIIFILATATFVIKSSVFY